MRFTRTNLRRAAADHRQALGRMLADGARLLDTQRGSLELLQERRYALTRRTQAGDDHVTGHRRPRPGIRGRPGRFPNVGND